jgi:hypothetical protein
MLAATFLAIFFVPLFFKLINDKRFKTFPEDFHHPDHIPLGQLIKEKKQKGRSNYVENSICPEHYCRESGTGGLCIGRT